MSYFARFPDIIYDVNGDGNFQVINNLLRRVAFREKVRTNTLLYDTYDVREGESPESIAHKFYGDVEFHWIVLMVNNMTDRYHDWPMSTPQFLQFVNDKYDNVDAVHHYEITQSSGSTRVKIDIGTDNTDYPSATPITNFEVNPKNHASMFLLVVPVLPAKIKFKFFNFLPVPLFTTPSIIEVI